MLRSRSTADECFRLLIQLLLDPSRLARQRLDLLEQQVPPQPLRRRRQLQPTEPLQPLLRPQRGPPRGHDAGASQQRAQRVLGPRPLGDHPAAAGDQLAPGPDIGRGHVHRRRLAQVEQLGQPLGVLAVVLVLRAEDQPQSTRMRHRDPRGDRAERVVVVAVAATGLVADLEAVGQGLEDPHHLVDGADLGAADDLPGLAEDADRDALVVDIEPDVEHGCLLKSLYLGNATTGFQVTRLTGASFIVSTPKSIDRFASDNPIHAQTTGGAKWSVSSHSSSVGCDRSSTWRISSPLIQRTPVGARCGRRDGPVEDRVCLAPAPVLRRRLTAPRAPGRG